MCKENKVILYGLLFLTLIFYITACKFAIPRPPVRNKFNLDNNIVYIGKDVDYPKEKIIKRFQEFKQCVTSKGYEFKMEDWTIYFINDVFWWGTVIGVTYPKHKVMYIMSFFEWLSFEHELMHAIGYLDGEHQLTSEDLRVCMKE